MSTARDRLVMSLVVARTELDDLSHRLDGVVAPGSETTTVELDDDVAEAEVSELVSELDEKLPEMAERASGRRSKADDGSSGDSGTSDGVEGAADAAGADDDRSEVIDLTGTSNDADGKPGGGSGSSGSKPRSGSGRNGSTRKNARSKKKSRRRSGTGQAEAAEASTAGSATAVAEPPEEDDSTPDLEVDAEVDVDVPVTDEHEAGGLDETEAADTHDTEDTGDAEEIEDRLTDDVDDEVDAATGLSLIEGFNTIELSEAELGLPVKESDGADGTDEQVITTVVARENGEHTEGNRGDLLIDEDYRGRLPSAIAARDTALASAAEFHRSIRRALNDDQSEVLDRLRAGRGAIEVSELPRFADQMERYVGPLHEGLAPVALAGAKAGGRREVSSGVLDNLARQLAKYIVDKVRIPVIREVEHATDHDREKLFEPIRSIYRDFRNTGLLDLADDALYEAFAIGLYGAIEAESPVIWLLDPRHDPDPVCEINAGRTGLIKGQKFPSGHVRPLALPNCRCLVVAD